jgi:predicted Zn-dependent protease with MMP-like domain
MNREEFELATAEAYEALPERIKKKIQNVAILVDDEVSGEARGRSGIGPHQTLLGLYIGIPRTQRGSGYGIGGPLPDSIYLFRGPIERAGGGDPEKMRKIIFDTLWHEVAHHFGMNEGDVRYLEKKQGRGYRG